MKCPYGACDREGKEFFKGFCSNSHRKLHSKKPLKVLTWCAGCDTPLWRNASEISEGGKSYCSRCPKNSGENHYKWKEGQYINPAGYRLILVKSTYKLEHRHTWEHANNSCILPQCHGNVAVHHINMQKLDNRPENLILLSSEEHGRVHRLIDAGKLEAAEARLLNAASEQKFYLEHPDHLNTICNTVRKFRKN